MRWFLNALTCGFNFLKLAVAERQDTLLKRRRARLAARRARDRKRTASVEALLTAMEGPFVVADLETTGLGRHAEILEIAAVRVDSNGRVIAKMSNLVRIKRVPPEITALTGITNAHIRARGVPLADALQRFLTLAGAAPVVFHNASFDTRFLRAAAACLNLPFLNTTYCSLALARAVWPGLASHKLNALAKHVGMTPPAHRALDDVRTTLAVLLAARRAWHGPAAKAASRRTLTGTILPSTQS